VSPTSPATPGASFNRPRWRRIEKRPSPAPHFRCVERPFTVLMASCAGNDSRLGKPHTQYFHVVERASPIQPRFRVPLPRFGSRQWRRLRMFPAHLPQQTPAASPRATPPLCQHARRVNIGDSPAQLPARAQLPHAPSCASAIERQTSIGKSPFATAAFQAAAGQACTRSHW